MSGNKRLNMQKTSESPLILKEAPGNCHSPRIERFLHGKNIPRNFYDLANLLKTPKNFVAQVGFEPTTPRL